MNCATCTATNCYALRSSLRPAVRPCVFVHEYVAASRRIGRGCRCESNIISGVLCPNLSPFPFLSRAVTAFLYIDRSVTFRRRSIDRYTFVSMPIGRLQASAAGASASGRPQSVNDPSFSFAHHCALSNFPSKKNKLYLCAHFCKIYVADLFFQQLPAHAKPTPFPPEHLPPLPTHTRRNRIQRKL